MAEHSTSIFAEFSLLATRLGAVNLGQGFPDTDGPQELKDAAENAIEAGLGNQYPPAHGVPVLREAIADHQRRFYSLVINPDSEVVVATGASEAIQSTLLALVEPGDEVLMFEPYFDIYAAGTSLARGTRVAIPMDAPGYRPNIDALEAAITDRSRLLILNSPHNPTGIVLTREELERIAAIAIRHDLIVISDEAYEHLWFEGHPHIPMSTLPGMFERTITIASGGKMFSFTGWKVGWATGPAALINAVRVVRQHLSYVSGGPFQHALAAGLNLPDQYFTEMRRGMSAKADLLSGGLDSLGFGVVNSQGTYYVTTDVRPMGFESGLEFCRVIPERAGVVAIPHEVFCDHPEVGRPFVRWAFCKKEEVLHEALDRLGRAFA